MSSGSSSAGRSSARAARGAAASTAVAARITRSNSSSESEASWANGEEEWSRRRRRWRCGRRLHAIARSSSSLRLGAAGVRDRRSDVSISDLPPHVRRAHPAASPSRAPLALGGPLAKFGPSHHPHNPPSPDTPCCCWRCCRWSAHASSGGASWRLRDRLLRHSSRPLLRPRRSSGSLHSLLIYLRSSTFSPLTQPCLPTCR